MANRRTLKKSIKLVSMELITECYVYFILYPNASKEQINSIVSQINKLNYNLVTRINHTDGKNNNKITKSYYSKLIEDWNKGVNNIIEGLEKIDKNNK